VTWSNAIDDAVDRVKYSRTPYLVVSQEYSVRKDVYGSIADNVVRQAQLLRGERDARPGRSHRTP
jgi:hypothetical protein